MTPDGQRGLQIVPSLLAADLTRLGEQLDSVRSAGIEWVSVDVMDGHFVPNLSFGPDFVGMVKKAGFFVDAHLMVSDPETAVPWFIAAGADIVTFHAEAAKDARALLKKIRSQGVKAGLAVKPATAAAALTDLITEMDLALVMTVEPGFGGAKFLDDMLPKLREVRQAIDQSGRECWLQVDGGIKLSTVSAAAEAGADSIVAGTAVFGADDIPAAVKALKKRAVESFKASSPKARA